MIFSGVKSITIPEGKVTKIACGDVVLWSAGKIPSEYQEVEYISKARSTMAYFDLGFAFDKGATIYLNYNKTETSYYIFGAAENSGKLRCMITEGSNISFYGTYKDGSKYITTTIASSIGEHKLKFTIKEGNMQGEDLATSKVSSTMVTQGAQTMASNLYLFAQNYNGSVRSDCSIQVKSFLYYDNNDNLICELVPCYRKSDGVIGMYDVVRKIFLTNAGSGTFTKGADV